MRVPAISKLAQIVGWLIAGLLGTIMCGAVGIRVDQHLLRRDAERLLLDLKSLELRKSTYADARCVIDHWYEHVRQEGPCAPYWCDVQISFSDFFEHHMAFFMSRRGTAYLYHLLGGRPAEIRGFIRVRNNIVWGKGIGAYVASDFIRERDGGWLYFVLIGRAGSGSPRVIVSLHPEYRMGQPGGCTACTEGYVTFTPYANPADVARLMDINFSCLTRWHPCKTQEDILPMAWKQAMAESGVYENNGTSCTPAMIRVLGRESSRVAIGRVDKLATPDEHGYREVTLALVEDLKPGQFQYTQFSLSRPQSTDERIGQRYILFLSDPNSTYDVAPYRSCDLVPVTSENLGLTRRGISEDWRDHNDISLPPGLRDIKPPTADVP